ncbi:hypothetical protein JYU34_009508 [Plutella xylostella]|uniref:Secreted protein n=1 Tax=Plutella xylostella TaxID=51655 RepID=A0ABQ7QMV2_PLUXY|nr:hypothetical protein JYU34_009508 [Plutella xylostella]
MGIVVVDFFLPLGKVSGAGLLGSVGVAGSASCVTGNGNYRLISPEARSARRPDMNFRYEQFGVRNWTSSASACIQPTAAAAAAAAATAATVARRRRLSHTSHYSCSCSASHLARRLNANVIHSFTGDSGNRTFINLQQGICENWWTTPGLF